MSLCPKSQVLGVLLWIPLVQKARGTNWGGGEPGRAARAPLRQFCCRMRFSSSSAERSRKAADSR